MEEKERKFKVGDKVLYDNEGRYDPEEFTICKISDNGTHHLCNESGHSVSLRGDHFVNQLFLIKPCEPQPLTWIEIQEHLRKPVWDNERKRWGIVESYSENTNGYKAGYKSVRFTDHCSSEPYKEDRFYAEEVGE